jgi:hypothetical protein
MTTLDCHKTDLGIVIRPNAANARAAADIIGFDIVPPPLDVLGGESN